MDTNQQRIVRYYQQEMEALRHDGAEFAAAYPEVAAELGMGTDTWTDPQAEMLLQSFAYLTARIRNQVDLDQGAVPNSLLDHLCPHMQAPVPSMAVVQAQAAATADGRLLERGRLFSVEAKVGAKQINCRFRNCYDTPIWPLDIAEVEAHSVSDIEFINSREGGAEIHSAVRVRLQTQAADPIQGLDLEQKGLRFFLSGKNRSAHRLYELLNTSLNCIYLRVPGAEPREMSARDLVWRGFEDGDALLPDRAEMHPGYRLIREYFGFPEKFLFFDIQNMDTSGAIDEFELYFVFDEPLRSDMELAADSLRLNCFPVINLYEQSLEPIRLTQRQYEYPLEADRINRAYSEVYAVESLYSVKPGEAPQPLASCYELSEFEAAQASRYFYSFRREATATEQVPGTRAYVSFHNQDLQLSEVPAETIGGTVWCTNRRLPEKLNGHQVRLQLEGAGPVTDAKLVSRVSAYTAPRLDADSAWKLVSQLSLNFLSVAGSEHALETFKHILQSYADTSNPQVLKQIASLKSVVAERETRWIQRHGKSGMAQGIRIRINIHEQSFTTGSPVLFASVCRYFFALYTTLGTFVQLVLETDKRGDWKIWPPMAGALEEL